MSKSIVLFALLALAPSAQALIQLSKMSVNFGNVTIGQPSPPDTVFVTNVGNVNVQLSLSSSCSADYNLTNMCHMILNPGMGCSLQLRFFPHRAGHQSCTIWVNDVSGGSGSRTINVSGNGV